MWFDDVIGAPPEDLMNLLNEALSAGPSTAQKILIFATIMLTCQLAAYATFLLWKKSGKKSGEKIGGKLGKSQGKLWGKLGENQGKNQVKKSGISGCRWGMYYKLWG
jgi:hypothetical protein